MNNKVQLFWVVSLLVILIVVAYWQLVPFKATEQQQLLQRDELSLIEVPSTIDGAMVGWQIYRDEDNGFTFKYPADWSCEFGLPGASDLYCQASRKPYLGQFNVQSSSEGRTLEELINDARLQAPSQHINFQYAKVAMAGADGFWTTGRGIMLLHQGMSYSLPPYPSGNELVDKIMGSFEFID